MKPVELDSRIAALERDVARAERQEGRGEAVLPASLSTQRALRERVAAALATVNAGQTRSCQPTEPDARRMACNDVGNKFAYNAQAVVDSKRQIVVAAEVSNEPNDEGLLHEMVSQAHANTGVKADTTVADAGYVSGEQFQKAEDAGYNVLVVTPTRDERCSDPAYAGSRFVYDEERDVVICPAGNVLKPRRTRMRGRIRTRSYRSITACGGCAVRDTCAGGARYREIDIRAGRAALQRMRQRMAEAHNQHLMRRRKGIVEPVFARTKEVLGFRRWPMFGLQNARATWYLLCAVHNLQRLRLA